MTCTTRTIFHALLVKKKGDDVHYTRTIFHALRVKKTHVKEKEEEAKTIIASSEERRSQEFWMLFMSFAKRALVLTYSVNSSRRL